MSSSAFDVVRTTTGISLRLASSLISRRTSRPSFLGRFRSRRIRSGRGLPAYSPCRRRKAIALTPSSTAWRLLRILHSLKPSRARRTSPGLSSTIRISTGVRGVLAFMSPRSVGLGNGEEKRGAVSGLRFDPDSPAVAFHDPLAQGQADASPRVFGRDVQPLKNDEDAIEIFWLDADAVVFHRK